MKGKAGPPQSVRLSEWLGVIGETKRTNMTIKYEAVGPRGWSVSVFINNDQAHDVVTVGSGNDAVSYYYESRKLTGPELRLLAMDRAPKSSVIDPN